MKRKISFWAFFLLFVAVCCPAFGQVTQATAWANKPVRNETGYTVSFGGQIYTDRAGQIQYRWERCDGGNPVEKSFHAATPGWYKVEPAMWQLEAKHAGAAYWVKLTVIHPNDISAEPVKFVVP